MRPIGWIIFGLVAGLVLGFGLAGWLDEAAAESRLRPSEVLGTSPTTEPPTLGAGSFDRATDPSLRRAVPAPEVMSTPAVNSTLYTRADEAVGILLFGSLADSDGNPIEVESGSMAFLRADGTRIRHRVRNATTYSVTGLSAGHWTIQLNWDGFRPLSREIDLRTDEPVRREDLVLESAVILLVEAITPDGMPLMDGLRDELGAESWDVRISAIATAQPLVGDLPEISHRAYSRYGIGRFDDPMESPWPAATALPGGMLGRLELDDPLPAYVSLLLRHVVIASQRIEPGTEEVVFVVPLADVLGLFGEVRIQIVDADTRDPITDGMATLTDSQSMGGGDRPDDEGRFEWTMQRPGLLELEIRATGYEYWVSEVSVPPGGVADLGTVSLYAATNIHGRVIDADGNPQFVGLQAYPAHRFNETRSILSRGSFQSAADGTFSIGPVGRRKYELLIGGQVWAALPVFVDTYAGDVQNVVITVSPATMLYVKPTWPADRRFRLRVVAADGLVISDSPSWDSARPWWRRLVRGDYVVELIDGTTVIATVPVTVGKERVNIEIGP